MHADTMRLAGYDTFVRLRQKPSPETPLLLHRVLRVRCTRSRDTFGHFGCGGVRWLCWTPSKRMGLIFSLTGLRGDHLESSAGGSTACGMPIGAQHTKRPDQKVRKLSQGTLRDGFKSVYRWHLKFGSGCNCSQI